MNRLDPPMLLRTLVVLVYLAERTCCQLDITSMKATHSERVPAESPFGLLDELNEGVRPASKHKFDRELLFLDILLQVEQGELEW